MTRHASSLDIRCQLFSHHADVRGHCHAGPEAPTLAPCSEGNEHVLPHTSLPQQHVAAAPASLKDAPSLDWEWFLHQSSLEPLLEESNAVKGI